MNLSKNIRVFVATALPFVMSSLPVWAEEAEAGEKGGLPQFDTSLFPEQIFWLVVSFAVLYLLMSVVALPRVARTQGNRKNVIAAEIDAARKANDTAQATSASVVKSLGEARAKAQSSVSAMLVEVAEESSQHHAAKEKELLRHLHRAEEDIAVTREAAMHEVRASASDLANAIVGKILASQGRVGA